MFDLFLNHPLLNLLELFFRLTNDIGIAILILASLLNLALFPLFRDSYITGQKMKVLSPELKKIQEANKQDPQKLMSEIRAFYKKHNIKNGATFLILIFQITFFTALYFLITKVSHGDTVTGLYQTWFSTTEAKFPVHTILGGFELNDKSANHLWLVFLVSALTSIQGLYTFKWARKPNLPIPKQTKNELKPGQFDPESFQKTMEKFSIYVLPIMFFFINMSLTIGVTLYFLATSIIGIIRQVVLSEFYSRHVEKLFEDIAESDPTSKDKNFDNNIENTLNPDFIDVSTAPTKMVKKKLVTKSKKKKKK